MFNRISRDERARVLALSMAVDVAGETGDEQRVVDAAVKFHDFLTAKPEDKMAGRRKAAIHVLHGRDAA